MTPSTNFECYSQRLLNPFRGTMHCLRYRAADVVTADGRHWDIYVSNEGLMEGLPEPRRAQVSDIRFGTWSREQGLRRGPLFPSDDFLRMEAIGQRAYEYLLEVHEQLPFPLRDVYELWLLDPAGRPLVLLDSALTGAEPGLTPTLRWTPGINCRQSFTSIAAQPLELDHRQPAAVADYLAGYINWLAGTHPAAQRFRRNPDGSGQGLDGINLADDLAQRVLDAEDFPPDYIELSGHDAVHRQLLQDFVRWQAPWQLLRQDLDAATRSEFEHHASVQPLKIASQYRLYPEIINRGVIDAARVEARLRESLTVKPDREKVMSTFYIELSPERAD
jgi:hypothetical protein